MTPNSKEDSRCGSNCSWDSNFPWEIEFPDKQRENYHVEGFCVAGKGQITPLETIRITVSRKNIRCWNSLDYRENQSVDQKKKNPPKWHTVGLRKTTRARHLHRQKPYPSSRALCYCSSTPKRRLPLFIIVIIIIHNSRESIRQAQYYLSSRSFHSFHRPLDLTQISGNPNEEEDEIATFPQIYPNEELAARLVQHLDTEKDKVKL